MRYILRLLLLLSIALFSISCSSTSEDAQSSSAKEEPKPSPTVQKAFDTFNEYDFSKGSDEELIEQVKAILRSPIEGDSSPDIETALAIVELFEITKDPLIKGMVNISIENYESVVSDVMKQFQENRFSFAFGEGISLSAPQTAHKTAQSFKEISDKLSKSFASEDYIFQYWGEDGLDYQQAQAIRVVLLGVASQLELLSAYDFGGDACYITKSETIEGSSYDYIEAQVDPASVLNAEVCGEVLVYREDESNNQKLDRAKSYLLESFEIAKDIDTTGLPTNESFTAKDYITFQKYLPDLIANLKGEKELAKIRYDGGLVFPIIMDIDLRVIFTPESAIDVNDVSRFIYICASKADGSNYSREKSIIAGRPMCENSEAQLWIDSAPKSATSDLDEFVQKAQWTLVGYSGQELLDLVYEELKPTQEK